LVTEISSTSAGFDTRPPIVRGYNSNERAKAGR